jgi:dual specificity tyrosine-phosphorylation-regulated kinase 2/3/4
MESKKILKINDKWLTSLEKQEINEKDKIYYLNTSFKQKTEYTHDERLKLNHDDQIDYRYQLINELGKGTFSNVYRCVDHKYDKFVAVKVIKNNERYKRQSLIEFEIYDLFYKSKQNSVNILQMLKLFTYRENLFIVYEIFGEDLYSYYKKYDTRDDVKNFGRQIASGLEFIHSFNIVHLDLKPENILIQNKKLKIIDFGSSTLYDNDKEEIKYYAQSRYYRAPEMIFKTSYGVKTDIWSFGCIIFELYTGYPLFPARTTYDLLIYYFHVLGYPNPSLKWIYDDNNYINQKKRDLFTYVIKNGKKLIPGTFEWKLNDKIGIELHEFLIESFFCWECEKRISAGKILIHPFFLHETTEV